MITLYIYIYIYIAIIASSSFNMIKIKPTYLVGRDNSPGYWISLFLKKKNALATPKYFTGKIRRTCSLA